MAENDIRNIIGAVFNEIADGIKSGNFGKRVKIALTLFGSEHSVDELVNAAEMATRKYGDFEIVLIGPKVKTDLKVYEVRDDEEGHNLMEKLLDTKEIDGCVTQHYNFPIGVSTVGRVVTPGKGKEMFIATTTGTSSVNRVEGMILNSIYGIIAAKACGIKKPTLGILNVDGARQVERTLKELSTSGYDINFASSIRADGGSIMRGNDLLAGNPDVMVCDTLTGNLLIKMFSSFTTGGSYESIGYGYGPGIGENYDRLICIVSRASGAPVICDALRYCAECAKNNIDQITRREFENANKSELKELIKKLTIIDKNKEITSNEVFAPAKKVVTYQISGIDILELENAVKELWKNNIYSESGMGCTGPIVLVSEEDAEKAHKTLKDAGFTA